MISLPQVVTAGNMLGSHFLAIALHAEGLQFSFDEVKIGMKSFFCGLLRKSSLCLQDSQKPGTSSCGRAGMVVVHKCKTQPGPGTAAH